MRKWWPLVAICTGAFMLLVDVTIVNVALPDMARQLHTTFPDLQWVIDLYALVLGALVLTVGSIADRVGRKRLYLAGLVLFAASSLTCGLAPNVGVLIAARGVQGLGGAAMFATTMALISSSYSGATGASRSGPGGRSTGRRRPSARSRAGCSPRTSAGAGSSWSTCRSASWRWPSR